MKTIGIIAEYNPFHKGHEYQIQELKRKTNADYVIIAMSGDFVQRGLPAIMEKHSRAKMALLSGADAVFELPVLWATSSAESFARAGVKLMEKTGIVDYLGFGAECQNLAPLAEAAQLLTIEDEDYQNTLKEALKQGLSFPKARSLALSPRLCQEGISAQEASSLLDSPNNILAIEYLKALQQFSISSITPVLIPRKGDSYHEREIKSEFASATALRQMMHSREEFDSYLPSETLSVLEKYPFPFIQENDISSMLYYALSTHISQTTCPYADCSKELWNRIQKQFLHYENAAQFSELLKTKDITYTRICRVLLHILLNISQNDINLGKELGYIPYLRLLGFRKSSGELLSAIKKEAAAPVISKVADASHLLSSDALYLLNKDIFASQLYRQLVIAKGCTNVPNEYTKQLSIIP